MYDHDTAVDPPVLRTDWLLSDNIFTSPDVYAVEVVVTRDDQAFGLVMCSDRSVGLLSAPPTAGTSTAGEDSYYMLYADAGGNADHGQRLTNFVGPEYDRQFDRITNEHLIYAGDHTPALRLIKSVAGVRSYVKTLLHYDLPLSATYKLEITRAGALTAYIDGVAVLSYDDSAATLPMTGRAGIFCARRPTDDSHPTLFQRFRVTDAGTTASVAGADTVDPVGAADVKTTTHFTLARPAEYAGTDAEWLDDMDASAQEWRVHPAQLAGAVYPTGSGPYENAWDITPFGAVSNGVPTYTYTSNNSTYETAHKAGDNDNYITGDPHASDFLVYTAEEFSTTTLSIAADIAPNNAEPNAFGLVLLYDQAAGSYYAASVHRNSDNLVATIYKSSGAQIEQLGYVSLRPAYYSVDTTVAQRYEFAFDAGILRLRVNGAPVLECDDSLSPLVRGKCALMNSTTPGVGFSGVQILSRVDVLRTYVRPTTTKEVRVYTQASYPATRDEKWGGASQPGSYTLEAPQGIDLGRLRVNDRVIVVVRDKADSAALATVRLSLERDCFSAPQLGVFSHYRSEVLRDLIQAHLTADTFTPTTAAFDPWFDVARDAHLAPTWTVTEGLTVGTDAGTGATVTCDGSLPAPAAADLPGAAVVAGVECDGVSFVFGDPSVRWRLTLAPSAADGSVVGLAHDDDSRDGREVAWDYRGAADAQTLMYDGGTTEVADAALQPAAGDTVGIYKGRHIQSGVVGAHFYLLRRDSGGAEQYVHVHTHAAQDIRGCVAAVFMRGDQAASLAGVRVRRAEVGRLFDSLPRRADARALIEALDDAGTYAPSDGGEVALGSLVAELDPVGLVAAVDRISGQIPDATASWTAQTRSFGVVHLRLGDGDLTDSVGGGVLAAPRPPGVSTVDVGAASFTSRYTGDQSGPKLGLESREGDILVGDAALAARIASSIDLSNGGAFTVVFRARVAPNQMVAAESRNNVIRLTRSDDSGGVDADVFAVSLFAGGDSAHVVECSMYSLTLGLGAPYPTTHQTKWAVGGVAMDHRLSYMTYAIVQTATTATLHLHDASGARITPDEGLAMGMVAGYNTHVETHSSISTGVRCGRSRRSRLRTASSSVERGGACARLAGPFGDLRGRSPPTRSSTASTHPRTGSRTDMFWKSVVVPRLLRHDPGRTCGSRGAAPDAPRGARGSDVRSARDPGLGYRGRRRPHELRGHGDPIPGRGHRPGGRRRRHRGVLRGHDRHGPRARVRR